MNKKPSIIEPRVSLLLAMFALVALFPLATSAKGVVAKNPLNDALYVPTDLQTDEQGMRLLEEVIRMEVDVLGVW